jgi:predicted nuclease of predicted toxin-antitoxin system
MNSSELKFLVDVGVGRKVEEYLHNQGYDTKAVRDIDSRMQDIEIMKIAVSEGRMVITMDKDFGELIYHFSVGHCGVLLLRLEDATGTEKVKVVGDILASYSDRIRNCFCVYQSGKFRIRKIRQ